MTKCNKSVYDSNHAKTKWQILERTKTESDNINKMLMQNNPVWHWLKLDALYAAELNRPTAYSVQTLWNKFCYAT